MNKKNNFMNKKNNNNRNNNTHNGHQGFQGGRGGNSNHSVNLNNRALSQWNERLLMQRICDGAIVTLLSNAIAAASSVNSSTHPLQNSSPRNTISISPPTIQQSNTEGDKDDTKEGDPSSPSEDKTSDT